MNTNMHGQGGPLDELFPTARPIARMGSNTGMNAL